jgi:hypothetical protein
MQANRLGLGLRPPLPSYGQGPSMSALAQQQQQQMHFVQPQAQKQANLFVGSISGGITDAFLNQLLSVRIHVVLFDKKDSSFSLGLWTHKIFQATYYPCKQTSRVWFCRV